MEKDYPETVRLGENGDGLRSVSDAIPFYWLIRLVEAAKQNLKGAPHIAPRASTNDVENRYRLVKT
jgi:hypothetical protein